MARACARGNGAWPSVAVAAAVAAVLALALGGTPVRGDSVSVTATTEQDLVAAVALANRYAKVCANRYGCLAQQVFVRLNSSITLSKALPGLKDGANLKIAGACGPAKNIKCVLDAQGKVQVFPPLVPGQAPYGGPPGRLELHNLIVQHAKGGVLHSVWATVTVNGVVFQENTGGVVLGYAKAGGYPALTFDDCLFVNNAGGVVAMGSQQFGLGTIAGNGGYNGVTVENSTFDLNCGNSSGAAVWLAGVGESLFDGVDFLDTTSGGDGGAVYLDSTIAKFRNVRFQWNRASPGRGGAVAARSSWYSSLYASFAATTFADNRASLKEKGNSTNNLFFASSTQYIRLYFCDMAPPPGTAFVRSNRKDSVNLVRGRRNTKYFC